VHVILDTAKLLPNKQFCLAGGGEEFLDIEQRIKREVLQNVRLLGRVNDDHKVYLLEKCKMLILPSITRGEAFGIVLLEAMREALSQLSRLN
jgi:rhamnosyl/mannosyltransferase